MPALYDFAQHDALKAADDRLLPDELLLSFLDDLYLVTCRARAHDAFRTVADEVETRAGVRTHLGKLRAWSSGGGPAPQALADIDPDIWTADKIDSLNGIMILGTPLGKNEFVDAFAEKQSPTNANSCRKLNSFQISNALG